MFDKKEAIEKAKAKLRNQQDILQKTLQELDYIEATAPNMTALIKMTRTKRNRQESAVRATLELIELLERPDPNQTELLDQKRPGKR